MSASDANSNDAKLPKTEWETPKLTVLGQLKDFINAGNPGKSSFGSDGGGGGGPEMTMG